CAGDLRAPRRIGGRRVAPLARELLFAARVGRLVDEDVRVARERRRAVTGGRVGAVGDAKARARGAEDHVRCDGDAVGLDLLPALQTPERRSGRNAEGPRRVDVEAPRPVVLDVDVSPGGDSVAQLGCFDTPTL